MRIQDAIVHLLLKQPFYGHIAASFTPAENTAVKKISMQLTPFPILLYNKEWYEALEAEKAIGIVIHELLHLVFMHPFREGNRERLLWVLACDMAVNEHIEKGLHCDNAVTVEKIAAELKLAIPPQKSAEFYYDIISKDTDQLSLIEKNNEISVRLKSGLELSANSDISKEGDFSEINKSALKNILKEIIQQAEAGGEVPDGISNVITEIYKNNEINWRNVLKRFLTGKGKTTVKKTFKRVSKRFDDLPGNKRSTGTNALLALDESGSISDEQAVKFYGEMLSISKITGAQILVTQFDTMCTQPVPIRKFVKNSGRIKNGGTDFRPVFELADKIRIHLLIIFTDGEGETPEQSNQNVLWVLTKGGKKPANFGHSVNFSS